MTKATDYCLQVFDGTHETPKPTKFGYKLLTSKNILNGKLDKENAYFISEKDYSSINQRSRVHQWDVLFSMIGTVGNVCIVTDPNIDFAIKNMGVFSCRDEKRAKWLYYYLKSPYARKIMENYMNGAIQKFLPLGWLRDLDIPDYSESNGTIADFLWSIDAKLTTNARLSSTLESAARLLYDYWFVQFDFPDENGNPYKSAGGKMRWNETLKREIPSDWSVGSLHDLLEIGHGKDHRFLSKGDIPVYGSGGIMRYVDKSLHIGESVLIPRKGTLNNIIYVNGPIWTVDTMYYSRLRKEHTAIYTYYSTRAYDFERLNTGTGVPSMTSDVIYKLKVLLPPHRLLKKFDLIAQTFFQHIQHSNQENQRLTALRDFLLPLLMNGQARLS